MKGVEILFAKIFSDCVSVVEPFCSGVITLDRPVIVMRINSVALSVGSFVFFVTSEGVIYPFLFLTEGEKKDKSSADSINM